VDLRHDGAVAVAAVADCNMSAAVAVASNHEPAAVSLGTLLQLELNAVDSANNNFVAVHNSRPAAAAVAKRCTAVPNTVGKVAGQHNAVADIAAAAHTKSRPSQRVADSLDDPFPVTVN